MSSEHREPRHGGTQTGAVDIAALAGALAAAVLLGGCNETDNRDRYCYRTTCENASGACCPAGTPGLWDPSSGICACNAADADADADEDAGADAGADADADGDAGVEEGADDEADGDAATDTLTFQVVDDETAAPLSEVDVLVQTAAGDEWLATDLDGTVTVDGLDLAGDPPTVTFYKAGYRIITCVSVDRQLLLPVTLSRPTTTPQLQVTGAVTGLMDTQRAAVSVRYDTGLFRDGFTTEPLDGYMTWIPPDGGREEIRGQAFAVDLVTGELQSYVRGSSAYSCPAEPCPGAVLDFAMPAEPPAMTHRSVTLAYPAGSDVLPSTPFVPVGDGYISLFSLWGDSSTDGARVGTTEGVEASTSPPGLTVRVGWPTDLAGYAESAVVATFQVAGSESNDVYCETRHPGLPAEGETIGVLEPPVFTTPADPATALSMSSDTAAWTAPDWASVTELLLYSGDLRTLVWQVILPPAVTTFRFPPFPASFASPTFPMRFAIWVEGFEGAPESCWEMFNMGDAFTGRYVGSVFDRRRRAVR